MCSAYRDTELVMLTLTFQQQLSGLWDMFLKRRKSIVVAWGSLEDKTNPDNNFKSKKLKK